MGADWVAAGAALLAAAFTAVNLWLTGVREARSRNRASLEDAFVDYVSAAHRHRSAVKHRARPLAPGSKRRTPEQWDEEMKDSHETMLHCLSRIRVLTDDRTATLCEEFKTIGVEEATEVRAFDVAGYERREDGRDVEFEAARGRVVAAAQRELHVGRRAGRSGSR